VRFDVEFWSDEILYGMYRGSYFFGVLFKEICTVYYAYKMSIKKYVERNKNLEVPVIMGCTINTTCKEKTGAGN